MSVPSSATPRVLQVVLSLNPGGTERLVVQLATRLHRVVPMRVCCLDEPGSWASELATAGIAVDSLGRREGFHPALGRKVAAVARRHGATLIHAHHYSPFVYSCVSKVWHARPAVVFTEHGRVSDVPPSPKRRLANTVLKRVPAHVVAVSNHLKHHMVQEGFPARQVEVIRNGIEIDPPASTEDRQATRQALGASGDTVVIGTIARLAPVKDLTTLIHAIAGAASPRPLLLAIVGDGPERANLEAAAERAGIGAHVRFLGHRDDARTWLAGCDIFANSSISEGISLTILEGMAAGLPVVATAVGGTPEVVTDECGRLVPARTPEELGVAIAELAASRPLRQQLGAAGRRRVETAFSLDRMIDAYRHIYEEAG